MKRLIFGCGYLGLPTAKRWVKAGDRVYAVTREKDRWEALEAAGLIPVLGDVTNPDSLGQLPVADTVLFAVGMDRSRYSSIRAVYVEGLRNVLTVLSPATRQFIYISSTGVYGDFGGEWINEESETLPTGEGGAACLEAEALVNASDFSDRFTILRLAGIYGGGRIPLRAAVEQRQWDKLSAYGHLNLIHVADGARIIERATEQGCLGETMLVSDGNPVPRKIYYETLAEMLNVGPIDWSRVPKEATERRRGNNDKRISTAKLQQVIGNDFLFPDFRSGLKSILMG